MEWVRGWGQGMCPPGLAWLLSVLSFSGILNNRNEETGHYLSYSIVMDADIAKQPGNSGGHSNEILSQLLAPSREGSFPVWLALLPGTSHLQLDDVVCHLPSPREGIMVSWFTYMDRLGFLGWAEDSPSILLGLGTSGWIFGVMEADFWTNHWGGGNVIFGWLFLGQLSTLSDEENSAIVNEEGVWWTH